MIGHSGHKENLGRWFIPIWVLMLVMAPGVSAQIHFTSGSTGADGALIFEEPTEATTIVFDPTTYDPPLDPEGDNIFHFTTIHIPKNLTLRMNDEKLGSLPVIWLAQGEVQINGTLDLSGEGASYYDPNGLRGQFARIAGAGGFRGGKGMQSGCGPGAGRVGIPFSNQWGTNAVGGGAGHANPGGEQLSVGGAGGTGGRAYGNQFLMPLIGGSGGGGSAILENISGGEDTRGGGGGGGAILIASSVSISFDRPYPAESISVKGGAGELNNSGGGGSGGAIRLMAPEISGYCSLDARGGHYQSQAHNANAGSDGRIRIESYEHNRHLLANNFQSQPAFSWGSPLRVFPPETAPKVRVTAIDGVEVPERSRGFYLVPDVEIVASTTSTVTIMANYVPVGTEIDLTIQPEYESQIRVTTTQLQGTLEQSTAEARVRFPPGFSRGYVFANWTP